MRHAKAEDGAPMADTTRGLTAQGAAEARHIATRLARTQSNLRAIYHSGLLRARQTAEIVGKVLGVRVAPMTGLLPGDNPLPVANWLRHNDPASGGVMLVSHFPFVDRLESLMVAGDPVAAVHHFKRGSVARLTRTPTRGGYSLDWVMNPKDSKSDPEEKPDDLAQIARPG